jgi:cobalamin-dependent methionine synthase I
VVKIDFAKAPPKKPAFLGTGALTPTTSPSLPNTHRLDAVLPDLGIDRRFPAILDDPKIGEVARSLYDDARKMLDRIIKEKWFTARATIGFWPAIAVGDDIAVYACRRYAKPRDRDLPHAAATTGEARRPLQRRAVGLHRAARPACRIISAPSWSPQDRQMRSRPLQERQ